MKRKVSELEGAELDAAVAMASGVRGRIIYHHETTHLLAGDGEFRQWEDTHFENWQPWRPSTRWDTGGPIIERERIGVFQSDMGDWSALPRGWLSDVKRTPPHVRGPTPLIAAMRAYCASKLGETVELPGDAAAIGEKT